MFFIDCVQGSEQRSHFVGSFPSLWRLKVVPTFHLLVTRICHSIFLDAVAATAFIRCILKFTITNDAKSLLQNMFSFHIGQHKIHKSTRL